MNDEDLIRGLLKHAEEFGFKEPATSLNMKIYTVDIRGTVTYDELMDSITVDFHDVHAYHADGRKVTYCEGNADVLAKHLAMTQSDVAEWAKSTLLAA